jgi:hypothetical protein
MNLFRVIYTSQPFGFDQSVLDGILLDARRANLRDGVTGALICRADLYIQLLEGPEDAVRATIARIVADDRHLDVVLRVAETVTERWFGDWAMFHDPAASWIWTRDDVASGAVDRATEAEVTGFFARLRDAPPSGDTHPA